MSDDVPDNDANSDLLKLLPWKSVGTVSDTVITGGTIMETVLFTDQDIVIFVITASAVALVLSVLGLATTDQARADIEHQWRHEHQMKGLR